MKKEFTVPPVIFPSGGKPTTTTTFAGGGNLQHRRVPTVPFQPANPSIPFMSFDIGSTSFQPPLHGGATTTTSFSDEQSLLEELEIDPALIYKKTVSLLNPARIKTDLHESADLSGPFLYYLSFCIFQILSGKVQFGVVLGWIVVFSAFLYVVINMLEGKNGNLDLYRCFSVVGYSLLPVVIFSAVSLFVPRGGAASFGLGAVFVLWSTRICWKLLVEGTLWGNDHIGLIAYPCFLIYTLFSMLVMF